MEKRIYNQLKRIQKEIKEIKLILNSRISEETERSKNVSFRGIAKQLVSDEEL